MWVFCHTCKFLWVQPGVSVTVSHWQLRASMFDLLWSYSVWFFSPGARQRVGVSESCQTGYRYCVFWQGLNCAGFWGKHQVHLSLFSECNVEICKGLFFFCLYYDYCYLMCCLTSSYKVNFWTSGSVQNNSVIFIYFFLNRRILGSLISAHILLTDPKHPFGNVGFEGYDNELLHLAHDLAVRLLPAFENTSTGIPFPRVSETLHCSTYCSYYVRKILVDQTLRTEMETRLDSFPLHHRWTWRTAFLLMVWTRPALQEPGPCWWNLEFWAA